MHDKEKQYIIKKNIIFKLNMRYLIAQISDTSQIFILDMYGISQIISGYVILSISKNERKLIIRKCNAC